MADLTNSKPKDTYQRLVQVESDETNRFKRFQNGLGSPILSASFYTLEVANDLYVRSGSVYAQSFITTYTTSSTLFQSGSTKFGDGMEDKHEFSGSVTITGSLELEGTDFTLTGSFNHSGSYNHIGDTSQTGNTVRTGDTTLTGDLTHTGTILLNSTGDINLTGNIVQIGNTTQTGDTSITGDLTHSGSIDLNSVGDVRLTGNITQIGNVNQTGDTSITGNLSHSGSIDLNSIGDVRLTGNITHIGNVNQTGDSNISGDLVVGGTVTAQEFKTELVTSATIFESGSTIFGNSLDDTHTITGSVAITGSLNVDNRATAISVDSQFFMSPKSVGDMVIPSNYNMRIFHDTEITGELYVGANSDVYVVKYATTD